MKTASIFSLAGAVVFSVYFMSIAPAAAGVVAIWSGHGECNKATNDFALAMHDDSKRNRALAACEADRRRFIAVSRAAQAGQP